MLNLSVSVSNLNANNPISFLFVADHLSWKTISLFVATNDYHSSIDLGPAARILTEEFYSQKTNFITFQIERLKTVLSLESTFPNKQTLIQNEYSKRPTSLQKMIVACDAKDGNVVGFAEVDARSFREATSAAQQYSTADSSSSNNEILRSYMYNLAVDKKWKRKGIASALVRACEQFVSDAHADSCMERRLYLRVRKCNIAAIALYESLGYREMEPEEIQLSVEDINRDSLEDGELILFVKDLSIGDECTV
ncbi:hypothetical protein ACHAWU_008370 [Discostella pseudostelligera]|uniref:N-acetyltransferase domain-containing protein n=1 Tax=Discostella pseudostelligera TaxID=259834 RepID=A0ABD3M9H3_9STRA